jgi:hypothetical protein
MYTLVRQLKAFKRQGNILSDQNRFTNNKGRIGPVKCGLGVWTEGLAQNTGLRGLWLLAYVVKARVRMSGLGPIRPYQQLISLILTLNLSKQSWYW